MTTDGTPSTPEPGPDAGMEDIQADIERTRKELGETVEALAAKADVTGRAKQKSAEVKQRVVGKTHDAQHAARSAVTDDQGSVKPTVPVTALIVVAAVVAVVLWRRRR